jgi:hypothetical protein
MKLVKIAGRVALVVVCTAGAFIFAPCNKAQQAIQVTSDPQLSGGRYVPFTAHVVEELFDGITTSPADVNEITIGRKSDGSEVTMTTNHSSDTQDDLLISILDVPGSKLISLFPRTKSSMTIYLSPDGLKDALSIDKCPENLSELDDHSNLSGYDVVKYQENDGPGDRYTTSDEWIAPKLACFVMDDVSEVHSDSWSAWNRKMVTSLTEGEPAISMFEVPTGFVERSPRELNALWKSTFGIAFMPDSSIENLERQYRQGRSEPESKATAKPERVAAASNSRDEQNR